MSGRLVLLQPPVLAALAGAHARGQTTRSKSVTVTGDRAHLIETSPTTPPSASTSRCWKRRARSPLVSDTTIDRYGITGVDDLTAITPSAYTASYYGVEGAVNLRGTLAENYFHGFKRAENRGTYTTPLGDAAEIEILRGPPSPIYGAGKVGGLVNFVPKSESATSDDVWRRSHRHLWQLFQAQRHRPVRRAAGSGLSPRAACMPMASSTIPSAIIAAFIPAISCWS